ncbi:MAG TPA: protein kinase, partial [Gemmataceae bacterium]|nr:protein kinase [Gemmataceae bacterium]
MTQSKDGQPITITLLPGQFSEVQSHPEDPRVLQAVEEYLAAQRVGREPDRQTFLARYPEIAPALADCLDGLKFIQAAAPPLCESGLPTCGKSALGEIHSEGPLGDYRLVREIGRGGMGVVYEAVQISLGRRVALKVLSLAATLDSKQLQRFTNEARAAAHLHHQNIVPVYGVGCERGVHYYAMQFIDGQTMADLINELRREAGINDKTEAAAALQGSGPIVQVLHVTNTTAKAAEPVSTKHSSRPPAFCHTVARWGIQAAEALEHAHQLGVVHRDIKPANLLVDTRGDLWITDFGLAHCHHETGLTMSGELLGTLRYMSPEQASGKRGLIDHRTDIYSLAVTLYELLTLQAVFNGRDRHELLRQITFDEPRAPRSLNKDIPTELETVVLKAMAKHPDERYATAQELADDLRRYLDDKAVLAKRTTLVQKVRKWARRNKGVTRTALISVAVLLITVSGLSSLAALRLAEEQDATRKQLQLTKQGLYSSLVAQARASRLSRRMGQRFDSLKTLAEAIDMAREMNLPENDFLQLRNEVIACLALPDLRVAKEWDGWPSGSMLVDFDAALERYARVDRQGLVHIHRVADNAEIYCLSGFGPADFGFYQAWPQFSPDGQFLLLTRADRVKLWKLVGQEPVVILEKPVRMTQDFFPFSPDSSQLALAHSDGSIHLYDLSSGRQLKQLRNGLAIRGLAFHPKARQLALSHATGVQILDLATGDVLANLPEPGGVKCIAWHPDGKTLAVGDGIIHLWDVPTRTRIARLEGHSNPGLKFAFNHSGDVLAGTGWDCILHLWDTRTGRQLFSTPTMVQSFRFSPDDHLLAVGRNINDNKLQIWQVALPHGYRVLVRQPILDGAGYSVCATSPKERLLAVRMADGVGLWDLTSGAQLTVLPLADSYVLFEPSGALLTSDSAALQRWPIKRDLAEPRLLRIGPPQKLPVSRPTGDLATSKDGRVLAINVVGSSCGLVWHRDLPGPPVSLPDHYDPRSVDVSPDGLWVATGSHWGTKVKIAEARTGKLVRQLPVEEGSGARFSPDGRWLATSGGGCRLWAVDSWQEGAYIGGGNYHGGGSLAFSPDSKLLAAETGHGAVRLVDPDTGREYARLENPNQDRSFHICFSLDGTQLAITNNDSRSIQVWDLRMIREQLAKMKLDWDLPPYPPAEENADRQPLRLQVDLGEALNRNLALANNNNAWQLATHADAKLRDPLRAVELAQQAVALAPKEGIFWNTLGVAHYRAGNWVESIAALEKSMQLLHGQFESFNTFFLAMSHWQRNDKEQAHKWYNQAVRWME